jgi:DNA-binding Lrp family transcriptional regulator
MRTSLKSLLNKGKGYDGIINYIIDNELEYNHYAPIPLKKLANQMGVTSEVLRKQIHQIYKDILDEDTEFYIDFTEVKYEITLSGYKNTVYLTVKSLPVKPQIGENLYIPFFSEYLGSEYFQVKDIRHRFYNSQQIISINTVKAF